MKYNAEKNFTPLYVGEKNSNSPDVWKKSNTPPQIQLINPLGVGEDTTRYRTESFRRNRT